MAGYVWKGEPKPQPVELAPKKKLEPKPCGSTAAYKRHQRRKEPACPPCKQASAKARNQRKRTPSRKAA